MDIRRDSKTGKMYVLEVNAQCGISEDEDFTSIGAILRLNGKTFTELSNDVVRIIKKKIPDFQICKPFQKISLSSLVPLTS